jgi:hypothetical protein
MDGDDLAQAGAQLLRDDPQSASSALKVRRAGSYGSVDLNPAPVSNTTTLSPGSMAP